MEVPKEKKNLLINWKNQEFTFLWVTVALSFSRNLIV